MKYEYNDYDGVAKLGVFHHVAIYYNHVAILFFDFTTKSLITFCTMINKI